MGHPCIEGCRAGSQQLPGTWPCLGLQEEKASTMTLRTTTFESALRSAGNLHRKVTDPSQCFITRYVTHDLHDWLGRRAWSRRLRGMCARPFSGSRRRSGTGRCCTGTTRWLRSRLTSCACKTMAWHAAGPGTCTGRCSPCPRRCCRSRTTPTASPRVAR